MESGELISGKYRLQRPLGEGGMSSVWAARNELTDREFAIKFLLPSLSQNKDALRRLFQEARICGRIKHPAVVQVFDVGQADDGSPYLVMELLEGEGLDQRIDRSGPLPMPEAIAWLAFVARGLEEAHARGVLHRDLKPGNLFLSIGAFGEVIPKILDFGISKAMGPQLEQFTKTLPGAVLGSPAYMSPEQASGETELDARSDIWALGVILYEALTGQIPFDANNYNALMVAILNEPLRPIRQILPDIPEDLEAVVNDALAKDKAQRIGTARELAERLDAVLAAMPPSSRQAAEIKRMSTTLSPPPQPAAKLGATTQGSWADNPPAPARSRASVMIWLGAALMLVMLLAGTAVLLQLRPRAVAVAARSRPLVSATTTRVDMYSAEIRAQRALAGGIKLERPTKPETPPPPSEPSASQKRLRPPAPRDTRRPPQASDPHGGVDGPGF